MRTLGEGDDPDLVGDIKSLCDDYLQNERCVILAVAPANVDFHYSQIMADAKKVDPLTRRTIPVITKPDLIDLGAEKSVHDLLLGKSVKFNLGFHMVKCRGQNQLTGKGKKTLKDGIRREAVFQHKRSLEK